MTVNELCHKHNIAFIKADTYGVFAGVFCDFGKQFHVLDVDGKWHCALAQPLPANSAGIPRAARHETHKLCLQARSLLQEL